MKPSRWLILGWVGLTLVGAWSSHAATRTWTGANPGDWSDPANWSPAGVPASDDMVVINSGTVSVASAITVAGLNLGGGTVSGAGDVTITTTWDWSCGSISGSGKLIIAQGATANLTTDFAKGLNRDLDNAGTVHYSGTGFYYGYSASGNWTFNNLPGGVVDVNGEGDFGPHWNGTYAFHNSGTLAMLSGSLVLRFGSTHSGSFALAPGTSLNLHETHTLAPTSRITGAGELTVLGTLLYQGGDLSSRLAVNGGRVTLDGPTALRALTMAAPGILDANGPLQFDALEEISLQAGTQVTAGNQWLGATRCLDQSLLNGAVTLDGTGTDGTPQLLEVMGQDLGANWAGFVRNFAYGTLTLGNNTYVRLVDQSDNAPGSEAEALYVNSLHVPAGTTLDLNGLHLYVRTRQGAGTLVGGSATSVLDGGAIDWGAATVGSIATAGERDEWTFFGRAGRRVTVVVEPGGGFPPALEFAEAGLLDMNGTVLASNRSTRAGEKLLLSEIPIPADGTYRIQVRAPDAVPSSTGCYTVTLWDSTPDRNELLMNKTVGGSIATPYNVDLWDFTALANQQVQFDLVSVSGPGLLFKLSGPNGWIGFTDLATDSALITLPLDGAYTLRVEASAAQRDLDYAFRLVETVQTDLPIGSLYTGEFVGSAQAQIFRVTVPDSTPLRVVLNNSGAANRTELYVARGAPPTRGMFEHKATSDSGASQSLLFPLATPGTLYVLVYGDHIATPGPFTIQVTSAAVYLTKVLPDRQANNVGFVMTLTGAGFEAGTGVELLDQGGASIGAATHVSVDSFTQLTASFPPVLAAPGICSVRVRQSDGDAAVLPNAFTLLEAGQPRLVTRLVMPGRVGRNTVSTIWVEYANEGTASMLAPLLMVQSADPDGSDRPILSLDESRIVQNYWSAALPPGVGHLTRVLEHPVSGPDKVTTYIYDHATSGDRLRKVTYPNARWVEYFYDAVGNRTFTVTNGVQVDYTANDLNQYTSVGGVAFQYDADGNLTFDGVRTFEYDAQSRLVQETGPEGVTEYEYDALGNRTATVLNGQRTEYLLDPTGMVSVLAEHNELNQLIARNVHGLGLVARLGERGALSFYDFDALGSAIAVTAEAGSVLSRSAYTPFGEMLAQSGSPASPFEFVGQFGVTHEVNGLYFMRARYYDSRLGRFVTKDPIDLQAGDLNLYRYVLNSPVVLSDPSGLIPGVAEAPGAWGDIAGGLVVVVGTAFAIGTAPLATVLLGFLAGYIAIAAGLYQLAFPPSPSCSCTAPASGGPGSVALASDGGSGSANGGAVARCLCYPNSGGGQGAGGSSPIPGPQDPNKKTGPAGFGSAGFVLPDTVLPYRIDFENEPSATAPAQQVVVADALSPSLDSSTLEWTEIGWGDQFILVPPNTRHFETNVAVAIGGTSFEVHIELGFRPASNQAYAIFRSIDPDTSLPPPVETGFLPPEDGTGRGQGHVSYTVHAKAGLPTGREIRNVALIEFDRQPAIATNQRDPHNPGAGTDPTLECLNTIDAGTPVSLVQPLPPVVSRSFLVQWFGSDDGSGIVTYDVDVSTNGIDFTGWLERTPATEAAFVGVLGQTYYFRCRARDGVGHEEAVHAFADAFATVGEDFEASLGALILPAGQRGRLPIGLVSSEALSRFGLTLELPADGPIDPGVRVPESAAGLVCDAAIEPLADRVYRVNVAACDGQGLRGMQPVAWLYLTAASNQPSAVLTVHSRDLVGRKPDGTPATNLDAELGRVVVLGEAPLLEALRTPDGQPTLVLYGRLGTECTLEFNPDLGQPLAWQPTWQGRMTNLYLSFPTPGGLARAGFFRARVR